MKDYIITIVGAALLGAAADIISPEKWRKYVSLITGFIIISCIISPISKIVKTDIFTGFDEYEEKIDYERLQRDEVMRQTQNRIAEDVKSRIKTEFGYTVTVQVVLQINTDGKLGGVEKIVIEGTQKNPAITKRLCEVYGINKDEVEYE